MSISKTLLFAGTAAALISITALAHPHSDEEGRAKAEDGAKKEEKVKVYKFKGKDGEVKSKLTINDFEMDGFDLDAFMENFEGLESLEDLKDLDSLKDLSKLSELSQLSELADLGEFNVETFDLDDGGKKIVIKRGKDGARSEHELFVNRGKMHKKHKEMMEKHEDHMREMHDKEGSHPRHIIKRMTGKTDSNKGSDDGVELDGETETRIVIADDGDVKVLKEHDDIEVNVEKQITIENGKRKTRIVIEMESDEN